MGRSMMETAGAPETLWVEAFVTGCYIRNRLPHSTLDRKTPGQLWFCCLISQSSKSMGVEFSSTFKTARSQSYRPELTELSSLDTRLVIVMHQDNQSAVNMAAKPKFSTKTRYIELRHHFLLDLVKAKTLTVVKVGTLDQIADIFTKALAIIPHPSCFHFEQSVLREMNSK